MYFFYKEPDPSPTWTWKQQTAYISRGGKEIQTFFPALGEFGSAPTALLYAAVLGGLVYFLPEEKVDRLNSGKELEIPSLPSLRVLCAYMNELYPLSDYMHTQTALVGLLVVSFVALVAAVAPGVRAENLFTQSEPMALLPALPTVALSFVYQVRPPSFPRHPRTASSFSCAMKR